MVFPSLLYISGWHWVHLLSYGWWRYYIHMDAQRLIKHGQLCLSSNARPMRMAHSGSMKGQQPVMDTKAPNTALAISLELKVSSLLCICTSPEMTVCKIPALAHDRHMTSAILPTAAWTALPDILSAEPALNANLWWMGVVTLLYSKAWFIIWCWSLRSVVSSIKPGS